MLSVDNVYFEGYHQEVFGTNMYFYLEGERVSAHRVRSWATPWSVAHA